MINKLVAHQMDVARLNFSWGTHDEHANFIRLVRLCSNEAGRKIPIIQDLSGPRSQGVSGHEFQKGATEIITEKDLEDLKFGIEQNVDYVAMSFVGQASDVINLRSEMQKSGKIIPIISKIERKIALENIDEIIEVSDAIMIARGDLGNEVPIEEIPFIEKDIIVKCKNAKKPVIVATQMMLSMVEHPTPTRAEITDVAYAIINGADAVMLSEESAQGKYPLETVEIMERAILEAEKHKQAFDIVHPLQGLTFYCYGSSILMGHNKDPIVMEQKKSFFSEISGTPTEILIASYRGRRINFRIGITKKGKPFIKIIKDFPTKIA